MLKNSKTKANQKRKEGNAMEKEKKLVLLAEEFQEHVSDII